MSDKSWVDKWINEGRELRNRDLKLKEEEDLRVRKEQEERRHQFKKEVDELQEKAENAAKIINQHIPEIHTILQEAASVIGELNSNWGYNHGGDWSSLPEFYKRTDYDSILVDKKTITVSNRTDGYRDDYSEDIITIRGYYWSIGKFFSVFLGKTSKGIRISVITDYGINEVFDSCSQAFRDTIGRVVSEHVRRKGL